ncbi:MAG: hypothetical protein IT236_03635 [Bacteroidia bacterium]|nr:hypothetical protein [Bacteroidia bacterium]
MNKLYHNFYRKLYLKTGGFLPAAPLSLNVFPGDFFQIRNGEMQVLGNLFRKNILNGQEVALLPEINLSEQTWSLSDMSLEYANGIELSQHAESTLSLNEKQSNLILSGDFTFRANHPQSIKIKNWGDIEQTLIIKLTQTHYSFRDVYVVTESASASSFSLEIKNNENIDPYDNSNAGATKPEITDLSEPKNSQQKNNFFYKENKRRPLFFKAKKLVLFDEKKEVFVQSLMNESIGAIDWAKDFFKNSFELEQKTEPRSFQNTSESLPDMLPPNELNANTVLTFFKWADLSFDDIDKFFKHD